MQPRRIPCSDLIHDLRHGHRFIELVRAGYIHPVLVADLALDPEDGRIADDACLLQDIGDGGGIASFRDLHDDRRCVTGIDRAHGVSVIEQRPAGSEHSEHEHREQDLDPFAAFFCFFCTHSSYSVIAQGTIRARRPFRRYALMVPWLLILQPFCGYCGSRP